MFIHANKIYELNDNYNVNRKFKMSTSTLYKKLQHTYYVKNDLNKNVSLEYVLRWPGFIFENNNDALNFYNNVYSKLIANVDKLSLNHFSSPRGAVTNHSIIVIGIAPGDSIFNYHYPCWLLGSTQYLINYVLKPFKLTAYFTNIFKTQFKNNVIQYNKELLDISLENLMYELDFFSSTKRQIMFLGSYKEFDIVKRLINEKYDNFNFINIWHPSYIGRFVNSGKFDEVISNWQNSFKNQYRGDGRQ